MYKYEDLKPSLFTEDGQVMFLEIRDKSKELLKISGAFKMVNVISGVLGDSWKMLACVDRLVELNEIKEVTTKFVSGQDRVFIKF